MILADTSVWIQQLRSSNPLFDELLAANELLMHPFVIGELAMGNLPNRARFLADLGSLPAIRLSRPADVLRLVETEKLWGRGLGYTDANLLTSVRLRPGARLWSGDKRLRGAAERLGLSYGP